MYKQKLHRTFQHRIKSGVTRLSHRGLHIATLTAAAPAADS
jgi:hypothetical protein